MSEKATQMIFLKASFVKHLSESNANDYLESKRYNWSRAG